MNNKHIWDTINKLKDENKELKEEIEKLKQNTPEQSRANKGYGRKPALQKEL